MATIIEGVSRRKLYEYMQVLESFLLELEQYTLYKADKRFEEIHNVDQFQQGIFDIFSKCVVVINFFFENKILNSSQDFLKEVLKHQKNIDKELETMLRHHPYFNKNNKKEIIELYHILESKEWSDTLPQIQKVFNLTESFHSIIIQVLESKRKKS